MSKRPSLTQIKQVLAESAFDPRSSGPLKTLVDLGTAPYLKMRAVELLTDIISLTRQDNLTDEQYHTEMKFVIGILALARIRRGAIKTKERKARGKDPGPDRDDVETEGLGG